MQQRYWVIIAATVLAACILVITLFLGPSTPRSNRNAPPTTSPDGSPVPFDPSGGTNPRPSNLENYTYRRLNENGQLIEVFGRKVTPLPQGVLGIACPGSRIHFTPSRVIEILAHDGTFIAPDNKPQRGEFKGLVCLTFFDTDANRPLQLTDDSPDIKLRVFMEGAQFDLELGQLETEGKVYVTGPRVDFKGRGLFLKYNQLNNRIDRLVITEGESMRIKQEASPARRTQTTASQPANNANTGSTVAAAPTATKPAQANAGNASANTAAAATKPDKPPPIFYRLTLQKNVDVTSPEMHVQADKLVSVFALTDRVDQEHLIRSMGDASDSRDENARPWIGTVPHAAMGSRPLPHAGPEHVLMRRPGFLDSTFINIAAQSANPMLMVMNTFITQVTAAKPAAEPAKEKPCRLPPQKAMLTPAPTDMIVKWAGTLELDPAEDLPPDLAGPQDAYLELTGNVHITTAQKDDVKVARFDYYRTSGATQFIGSDDQPMVFESPRLGVLTGPSLKINQVTGEGRIAGAGSLKATGDPAALKAANAKAETKPADEAQLARNLDVTWTESLDLQFYLRPVTKTGEPEMMRLRAVKDAKFAGDVKVEHPRFSLASQKLHIGVSDPAADKQAVTALDASGAINAVVRDENNKPSLKLLSEELEFGLTRTKDGGTEPTRIIARKNVEAQEADRVTRAEYLDVQFAQATGGTKPGTTKGDAQRRVKTIHAKENVAVTGTSPRLSLTANEMLADTEKETLDLTGSVDHPARLVREDATLVGPIIKLRQKEQSATVEGPGMFDFVSAPLVRGADAGKGAAKGGNAVNVKWSKSMEFDNLSGKAKFIGDVEARAKQPAETTFIDAGELTLDFVPDPNAVKSATATPGKTAKEPSKEPASGSDKVSQQIKLGVATAAPGKVARFVSESWADEVGKNLASRITLSGPAIEFDNMKETVKVNGKGDMLIEDYRPRPKDAQPEGVGPVRFTGEGKTIFLWTGNLLLDAAGSRMTIKDGVQMLHKPAKGDAMQLDARSLVAELEGKSGLGAWTNSQRPSNDLKAVTADKDVRIIAGKRTITCDRLEYAGKEQIAKLKADDKRAVEIVDDGNPNAYSAKEFKWDLRQNRIEITEPGPARVDVNK